jgi:hypothetical protein
MDKVMRLLYRGTMPQESRGQPSGGFGRTRDRSQKGVTISADEHHSLVFIEHPPGAFVGQIARGKATDRHGLLNQVLGACRYPKLNAFFFEFPRYAETLCCD